MGKRSTAALIVLFMFAGAAGAKPPNKGGGGDGSGGTTTPNPQVAYETGSRTTWKLVVSNEDGTNASTLSTFPAFVRFDLAPRNQKQIAVSVASTTDPSIMLMTYDVTGTGSFATTGSQRIASARRGTFVDFSPDGRRIAFACCSNGESEDLVVYNLDDGSTTVWATAAFFWDIAWFRGGASLAYSSPDTVNSAGNTLYEVAGAGATPRVLMQDARSDIYVDGARTDPNALIVNYHDASGNALTGLLEVPESGDATLVDPNLTNSTMSFYSELNCDDREVAYQGAKNIWYIRDLDSGLSHLFSRQDRRWVQFWPTCS